MGDLANSDFRQMLLTIDTNFLGALRVLQAALPLLPKTGAAAQAVPSKPAQSANLVCLKTCTHFPSGRTLLCAQNCHCCAGYARILQTSSVESQYGNEVLPHRSAASMTCHYLFAAPCLMLASACKDALWLPKGSPDA